MPKNKTGVFTEDILRFAKENYGNEPEYLWESAPDTFVLRHGGNKKWYAVFMRVAKSKLGIKSSETVDIAVIKCDTMMLGSALMQEGFYPAYHMNKKYWISMLLDGTVDRTQAEFMLQMSYDITKGKSKVRTEPREWLIPANPKYEDLSVAFSNTDETLWKQSARFIVGDTVYIFEGSPIGAITYCGKVVEINIPYDYDDGGLKITKAVRLHLTYRFSREDFPRSRLEEFGIRSVRGPRGVPNGLSHELQECMK